MRFQQYINEIYLDRIKGSFSGKTYEVFKNPTNKEIRDIYLTHKNEHSGIRFFIDLQDKDVYVFYGDAMHNQVRDKLHFDTKEQYQSGPRWLRGEGSYAPGNKIEIDGISDDIPSGNEWLEKYFTRNSL